MGLYYSTDMVLRWYKADDSQLKQDRGRTQYESNQQQICAEHINSKCVGPDSVVIADKLTLFDVTSSLTGVIKNSCDIDAEKEKSLKEKYGFGN